MLISLTSPNKEGLTIAQERTGRGVVFVRELGKLDYVIYKYTAEWVGLFDDRDVPSMEAWISSEDVSFLLERITDLESRCQQLLKENPTPIELSAYGWNLDRAKKRFVRWYAENDRPTLKLSKGLRTVALRALSHADDTPKDNPLDILVDNFPMQGILLDYETRKLDKPILISSGDVPLDLQNLLKDANEAYRFGLARAAVALCRTLLEELLRRVLRHHRVEVPQQRMSWEPLPVLIEAMHKAGLLSRDGKRR